MNWTNEQMDVMKQMYEQEAQLLRLKRQRFPEELREKTKQRLTQLRQQFIELGLVNDDFYDFCDVYYEHFLGEELRSSVQLSCNVWQQHLDRLNRMPNAESVRPSCQHLLPCQGPLCSMYVKTQLERTT